MDFLLGFVGKDFVIVVADKTIARSILIMKSDQNKTISLGNKTVMLTAGEQGDCTYYGEFIQKNVDLYLKKNSIPLSTKASAHFTRSCLADYLRSRTPYNVNLLIAGYDNQEGPELYWIDYLASMQKLPYACHGYGSNFVYGILDKQHHKEMTQEMAEQVLYNCLKELSVRFLINLNTFLVQIIDKNGTRTLDINMNA